MSIPNFSKLSHETAEQYWARVRASLPPFKFDPPPPCVSINVTDDEDADVRRFKLARTAAIRKA